MEAAASSTEIAVLGWSVVLLLAQVLLQAVSTYDLGPYLLGPRDDNRQSGNVMALALALAVTGKTGGIAATGAWVWLIARVVYVPLYAFGVPAVRTLAWVVSVVGLLMMLVRLVA